MTIKELIEKLSQYDPNSEIQLRIADSKDSAYTKTDIDVAKGDRQVTIEGFVWSDDEEAFAPWQYT